MAIKPLDVWIATYIPVSGGNVKVYDGGTFDGIPKEFSSASDCLDEIKSKGFPTNDVKVFRKNEIVDTLEIKNNGLAGDQG